MRRRLALVLAAVLTLAAAPHARAEPLDIDLARLGPPTAAVWDQFVDAPHDPAALARDSRHRFAAISSQFALALSSAILQPASTTGHSGFAVDFEVATMDVDTATLGAPIPSSIDPLTGAAAFTNAWPTDGGKPGQLTLPSIHVRKAFPFSLEFGGRMIYLAESSYLAAQGEAKWALNEGFDYIPDLAVRFAYTRLFGHEFWNLGAADVDLMVSKRWGLSGVASVTPYLAARFTFVSASSDRMDFAPDRDTADMDPDTLVATQDAFPRFSAGLYRTTLGLRFTAYAVSLAAEATYFGGASPSVSSYEGVRLPSSFGGAAKLGWEF
jgi:hypothetical protein